MNTNRAAMPLLAIAALALTACSAGPTTIRLEDGSVAYRIDCGKSSEGLNFCFEKAGKSCGAEGYTVFDEQGQAVTTSAAASEERAPRVLAYNTSANSIIIRCGGT